jgi:hypothetical protein
VNSWIILDFHVAAAETARTPSFGQHALKMRAVSFGDLIGMAKLNRERSGGRLHTSGKFLRGVSVEVPEY